jgi:hypothetical protein
MKTRWLVVSCLASALGGCIRTGGAVDMRPMETAIASAASLGHASTLAMTAMQQTSAVACTQVTTACTTFPCQGAVTITLGNDCPLPVGGVASGTVQVTGMWSSATSAKLSTTYSNVKVAAGARNSVFVSATNVTATPTSVSYTGQDVQVQGAAALAAQSSWDVSIDSMGRLTVDGTNQFASSGHTQQTHVSSAVLDPACTLNPVSGSATIQDVGGLSVSQAHVTFHSACDGRASADGANVMLDFLAE